MNWREHDPNGVDQFGVDKCSMTVTSSGQPRSQSGVFTKTIKAMLGGVEVELMYLFDDCDSQWYIRKAGDDNCLVLNSNGDIRSVPW